MNDYVCWSADVNDLSNWRYEGVIFQKAQDPGNREGLLPLYAPDVQKGMDGRYYLYYCVNGLKKTSVAVCDSPAGQYEFLGYVKWADGTIYGEGNGDPFQFDPGVFIDDGRVFLYTGFAPWEELRKLWFKEGDVIEGSYCVELENDMITLKNAPRIVAPGPFIGVGTGFEGHEFFEASSMKKINGRYYLIYSSVNSHELCYATGDRPDGKFTYGGTLISNGDIFLNGRKAEDALNYTGNTHGSLVDINGGYYIFYHRHTNRHQFSRQACAERVFVDKNGYIAQVEMTSCGLNDGVLLGRGEYPTYIACNLMSKDGASFSQREGLEEHPYFTQEGGDSEFGGEANVGDGQYIANMRNGAVAGFKYFDLSNTNFVGIKLRGDGKGTVDVSLSLDAQPLASIAVSCGKNYCWFDAKLPKAGKREAIYFRYSGSGYIDFMMFELS